MPVQFITSEQRVHFGRLVEDQSADELTRYFLRNRVEERLWKRLGRSITDEQRTRLENLLTVPPEGRTSWLEKLRSGPVSVSGRALAHAIHRLQTVRDFGAYLGIRLPATGHRHSAQAAGVA